MYNTPDLELYDIEDDPDEVYNLAEEAPDVVKRLKAEMEDFLKRRLGETGLPNPTEEQNITMDRIGRVEMAVPRKPIIKREN